MRARAETVNLHYEPLSTPSWLSDALQARTFDSYNLSTRTILQTSLLCQIKYWVFKLFSEQESIQWLFGGYESFQIIVLRVDRPISLNSYDDAKNWSISMYDFFKEL